jgi:hypothetical protein
MIYGPDGQPIRGGAIVNPETVRSFDPFTADQLEAVVTPLDQALAQGVTAETMAEVSFGTLCMLCSTLIQLQEQIDKLTVATTEAEATVEAEVSDEPKP